MSTLLATKSKDADATLDYLFDWSKWLVTGDTIASSAVAIVSGDGALTNPANTQTSTSVRVWLSAGTAGTTYQIRCRITTANATPRIDERILELRIT